MRQKPIRVEILIEIEGFQGLFALLCPPLPPPLHKGTNV